MLIMAPKAHSFSIEQETARSTNDFAIWQWRIHGASRSINQELSARRV